MQSTGVNIPNTPANQELLGFIEKLKARFKRQRYNEWLKGTTGYPFMEISRAREEYLQVMRLRARLSPQSSS